MSFVTSSFILNKFHLKKAQTHFIQSSLTCLFIHLTQTYILFLVLYSCQTILKKGLMLFGSYIIFMSLAHILVNIGQGLQVFTQFLKHQLATAHSNSK